MMYRKTIIIAIAFFIQVSSTTTTGADADISNAEPGYSININSTSEITGLFWNQAESGWGVTLTQQYDIIFVTIFTYNSDGSAMWYVASNCAISNNTCTGTLYEVTGGAPLTSGWMGTDGATAVGDITVTFTDPNNAIMDFTINGSSGSKSIVRQIWRPISPGAAMTALWYRAAESGWGVTLIRQADVAFVTLFTYAASGLPTWFVASQCDVSDSGNGCTGILYAVTGGSPLTDNWAGPVTADAAGTITFEFSDKDNGTVNFEINGLSGSKSIARQVWANSPGTLQQDIGIRQFKLGLPLFSQGSAWNQSALNAEVLPGSEAAMLTLYRVLRGDISDQRPLGSVTAFNWPYLVLNYDEWTVPIFRGGGENSNLLLCDYEGNLSWPNQKFADQDIEEIGGPVMIPGPGASVRPSLPAATFSDGHLVLYDPVAMTSHEFWQATTQRDGECQSAAAGLSGYYIPEAGTVDFFDLNGSGSNTANNYSARASGASLLAGLFVPEDLEDGEIGHALALAIPGPLNTSSEEGEFSATDVVYPANVTETDYYSINPNALIMGQRLRLRDLIVDDEGNEIDESDLSPITQIFLQALRQYGLYVIDNASGFAIYIEDTYTGFLDLPDAEINRLTGSDPGTEIPPDKSKWLIVIEKLAEEIAELPVAVGPWEDDQDPSAATIDYANFELVEAATAP
jgi:hypothetical protein